MNNLLKPISWSAYLETIGLLAIAYYAFIAWRYYHSEITTLYHRITGQQAEQGQLPEVLQYHTKTINEIASTDRIPESEDLSWKPADFTFKSQQLAQRLRTCISDATDKPYAPSALIPQLKAILNDFPDVAATPERDDINAFIVREWENTGTALLSDSEVDRWWSA